MIKYKMYKNFNPSVFEIVADCYNEAVIKAYSLYERCGLIGRWQLETEIGIINVLQ